MKENTNITKALDELSVDELLSAINGSDECRDFERSEYIERLNTVLKEEKTESINSDILTFAHAAAKDTTAFFDTFIDHPYASYRKVKIDKDTGDYELVSALARITFEQVARKYKDTYKQNLARSERYVGMISRFTYNLYRKTHKELLDGLDCDSAVKKYTGKVTSKIGEYDFSSTGNDALCRQLNAIVAHILPEDYTQMSFKNADVRYILTGFANAKEGEIKYAGEALVTRLIWDAVKVRKATAQYAENTKSIKGIKVKETAPATVA